MYHEVAIDDLPLEAVTVAIARELFRYLGLENLDFKVHPQSMGEGPRNVSTERWRLAIARALITVVSSRRLKVFETALEHLRRARSEFTAAAGFSLVDPMRFAAVFRALEDLLLANQSGSREQLNETIDKLHQLGPMIGRRHLRYSHDSLLILVHPADRSWAVPLWAEEDVQPKEATPEDAVFPEEFSPTWVQFGPRDPHGSSFWERWYLGFVLGKPLDWELQRRVSEIDEEIWTSSSQRIADEIERIQADFLLSQVPLAETVEVNADSGLLHLVPVRVENAPLLSALVASVQDAVEDAVRGNNGLNDSSTTVRILTRSCMRYGNDPQRLEVDFTRAVVGLRRQIDVKDLPDSEDNMHLLNTIEEAVRGIRVTHPGVAKNREILAKATPLLLTDAERADLEKAAPELAKVTEGSLKDDFAEDIPLLLENPIGFADKHLPGPQADAAVRVVSRATKMQQKVDALTEKGAKTFDSKEVKTVRLVALSTGVLSPIVALGLRLFGVI